MSGESNNGGSNIEIAPIVMQRGQETVFRGVESTHFSHVEGQGFHVTTQIPGIPGGLSIHDSVSDMDFGK